MSLGHGHLLPRRRWALPRPPAGQLLLHLRVRDEVRGADVARVERITGIAYMVRHVRPTLSPLRPDNPHRPVITRLLIRPLVRAPQVDAASRNMRFPTRCSRWPPHHALQERWGCHGLPSRSVWTVRESGARHGLCFGATGEL